MHCTQQFWRAAALLAAVLYGSTILTQAQLTTIWSFTNTNGDGESPYPQAPLTFDASGNVYGTLTAGGSGNAGIVYELEPPSGGGGWSEKVLYSFTGGTDGGQPMTGVVFGSDGGLYATAYNGGGTLSQCGGGCGVVFKLTPSGGSWTQSVLYAFQGAYDGQNPGQVIFGPNGSLYGTTPGGGPPSGVCRRVGCGTIFQLTQKGSKWSKTILHTFPATASDGRAPNANIVFDSNGNLYGTAYAGGASNYGIVWQLSSKGTYTTLHTFSGGSDGGYPIGGLTVGADGSIYGTASYSGVANQSGTAFRLTSSGSSWQFSVLYSFSAGKNGSTPASTMAFDTSGNLYGTTDNGGSTACYEGCGTIFKLAPPSGGGSWTESVLFDLGNSGQNPNASEVVFHNSLLYGTTINLGSADLGSAFTLVP